MCMSHAIPLAKAGNGSSAADNRRGFHTLKTYRCEGCGTRHAAPAPYGGFWHTACSEACVVRAQRAARRRERAATVVDSGAVLALGDEGEARGLGTSGLRIAFPTFHAEQLTQ